MAELPSRKQQNQAFLQELEKQRLNKPCLRIIDLRGKVAGECQAYEFGGRVHYLDDRAFLLVKQLMSRCGGRYTVGVYEALLKALKQLNEPVPTASESNTGLPYVQLDQSLQRSAARTVVSTAVKIRLDDVLYHGHTVDLSPHAIRVSCKRIFSLEAGDNVTVEFPELAEQSGLNGLRHVDFRILKLDHDEKHTTLVLHREPSHPDEVTLWLSQWLEHYAALRQHDVDNELFNLQAELYQRLWLGRLASPLIWLGKGADSPIILKLHITAAAQQLLAASKVSESDWLGKLPLAALIKQQSSMLCACDSQHSFYASLTQEDAVEALINWHLATANSQLLLMQTAPISFDEEVLTHCINTIETQTGSAESARQLEQVSDLISICDLSPAFIHTLPTATLTAAELSALKTESSTLQTLPEPTTLRSCIQRDKARFYIRTPVTVHAGELQWQLETQDVSANGLAIQLPADAPASLNQRLHIDFSRWQTLTHKVKLDAIPYEIKNIRLWQGQKQLGLARIRNNCPESLNGFFDWAIAQNQQSLRQNHQDVITAAEGQLFSAALLPSLRSVPVFLGLDNAGGRQIQLIGKTAVNQADRDYDFWLALEQQSLRWNELLKQAGQQESGNLVTTLYAYKTGQQWVLAFEQDFSQARDKALFIRRGLDAAEFIAMHTLVTVLKGHETEQEFDLQLRMQQLRSQRAHRVRALRQQLSQLIGMLELTDISALIRQFYAR